MPSSCMRSAVFEQLHTIIEGFDQVQACNVRAGNQACKSVLAFGEGKVAEILAVPVQKSRRRARAGGDVTDEHGRRFRGR